MNSLNIKLLQYRAFQASQIALKALPIVVVGLICLSMVDTASAATGCKYTPTSGSGEVPWTVNTTASDVENVAWSAGCELMPLYMKISAFVTGLFMKIAGIVATVVGIGMGMAKSSIAPAGMGLGFGVVMLSMPSVLKNFFGAII